MSIPEHPKAREIPKIGGSSFPRYTEIVPSAFRFALCNELFGEAPLASVCHDLAEIGYQGVELAPFTLSADPASLTTAERSEISKTIQEGGLQFVGLHWLLAAPPGLHITASDKGVRQRTWDYVYSLIDLCADLAGSAPGPDPVVVFGSPKQRSTNGTMTPHEAVDIFTHELAHAAPRAETRGVTLLVEALSPSQTDVVTSLAEAVAIVRQVGSPAVQTMFDVHNAIDETDPHPELVRRNSSHIRHVHVNELDGREPGADGYDFRSLLDALAELNYGGWISVEAFDFSRDPREVSRRALAHLRASSPAESAAAQSI
jgi:sugar phosphate isomerase/epimerase